MLFKFFKSWRIKIIFVEEELAFILRHSVALYPKKLKGRIGKQKSCAFPCPFFCSITRLAKKFVRRVKIQTFMHNLLAKTTTIILRSIGHHCL